jgi:hypothetical protein
LSNPCYCYESYADPGLCSQCFNVWGGCDSYINCSGGG